MTSRGYDVVVVHPQAEELDGAPCFRSIAEVRPEVEAAMVLTPAASAFEVGEECVRAGVRRLWLYRGKTAPEGSQAVLNECPLMWLKDAAWFHRVHKGLRALTGTLPR